MSCPVCGSARVSRAYPFGVDGFLEIKRPGAATFFGGRPRLTISATTARICLQCGFLMEFVSAEDAAKLGAIEQEERGGREGEAGSGTAQEDS